MRYIFLFLALLPLEALATPVCATMDRHGYDAIKALPNVTYFESDCHFPGKYRDNKQIEVCYEDSVYTYPDGRVQHKRKVTCQE